MGRSILMSLVALQMFGLGVLAWAGSERVDRESNSLRIMESKRDRSASLQGTLSCEMPEQNNGEACILRITTASGESLEIIENQAAMRYFQSGRTSVVIDGEKIGSNLRVHSIHTL